MKKHDKKTSKKKVTPKKVDKIAKTMEEFEKNELHSGSKKGPLVKNKAQALAIGYSEKRKQEKSKSKKK